MIIKNIAVTILFALALTYACPFYPLAALNYLLYGATLLPNLLRWGTILIGAVAVLLPLLGRDKKQSLSNLSRIITALTWITGFILTGFWPVAIATIFSITAFKKIQTWHTLLQKKSTIEQVEEHVGEMTKAISSAFVGRWAGKWLGKTADWITKKSVKALRVGQVIEDKKDHLWEKIKTNASNILSLHNIISTCSVVIFFTSFSAGGMILMAPLTPFIPNLYAQMAFSITILSSLRIFEPNDGETASWLFSFGAMLCAPSMATASLGLVHSVGDTIIARVYSDSSNGAKVKQPAPTT